MKQWLGWLALTLLCVGTAHAEYRAYELEIFDRINDRSRVVITSFSPSDFIQVNGGPQRIGVIIRASWIVMEIPPMESQFVQCPNRSILAFKKESGYRSIFPNT